MSKTILRILPKGLNQKPHFIQAISMLDNLLLTQRLGRRKENVDEVKLLFNRLRMGNRIDALPGELSQGELQRASIIRAVINEPALLIVDEPTSALDDTNTQEVISILKDMSEKSGSALIIVTHDNRLKNIFSNQIILN